MITTAAWLAAATLVSEDAASLTAAWLVREGTLTAPMAITATAAGSGSATSRSGRSAG